MRHEVTEPRILGAEEILDRLRTTTTGRLVLRDSDRQEAYIVPVNFVLLARSLYFYTEAGRKLTLLEQHPDEASLQVDAYDEHAAWSLLASGTYVAVADARERAIATAGLLTKYRRGAVAPIWARSGGNWSRFVRNLTQARMGAIRLVRVSGRAWL